MWYNSKEAKEIEGVHPMMSEARPPLPANTLCRWEDIGILGVQFRYTLAGNTYIDNSKR